MIWLAETAVAVKFEGGNGTADANIGPAAINRTEQRRSRRVGVVGVIITIKNSNICASRR